MGNVVGADQGQEVGDSTSTNILPSLLASIDCPRST